MTRIILIKDNPLYMPGKNIIKTYIEKGFYHIYNRGVEEREIFLEDVDYKVFLSYLKFYLLPKEKIVQLLNKYEKENKLFKMIRINNFFGKIQLLAFVLMPNHFHLLIRQKEKNDIESFMKSLLTKYVIYFNKKNKRVGPLFQGTYKAVLVEKEEQLLHLSRYIHLNPQEILLKNQKLVDYPWSSYPFYVKNYQADWLDKKILLSYFKKMSGTDYFSYQTFVEGYKGKSQDEIKIYRSLLIDI